METGLYGISKGGPTKYRKPVRGVSVSGPPHSTGIQAGNGIGITQATSNHSSLKKGGDLVAKCGCKKRHSRSCPLKKTEEDLVSVYHDIPYNVTTFFVLLFLFFFFVL